MSGIDDTVNASEGDIWDIIRGATDKEPERVTAALDRLQERGGEPLLFGAMCSCAEVVKAVWKDELADGDGMVIVAPDASVPCDCPGDVHDHTDGLAVGRFLAAYSNGDIDTALAVWRAAYLAGDDRAIALVFGIVAATGGAARFLREQHKRDAA